MLFEAVQVLSVCNSIVEYKNWNILPRKSCSTLHVCVASGVCFGDLHIKEICRYYLECCPTVNTEVMRL